MISLILIVHIIVSVCLILIVLLQVGKGASLSRLFGGGGTEAIFGGGGGDIFLRKLTVIFAILFLFTSLTLTVISARRPLSTIIYKRPSVPVAVPEEAGEKKAGPEVPPIQSQTPELPK